MKKMLCFVVCLVTCVAVYAADTGTNAPSWWSAQVPSSGFVPADDNPDFDKYMTIFPPMIKGKSGAYVKSEVVAKGWDKSLKTFYMCLQIPQDNPIRVGVPKIPATLPVKKLAEKPKSADSRLHSECKVLDTVDAEVMEVSGKIGLAVSMGTMGYIVGLPGSRLDLAAFTDKTFALAGRKWRATSKEEAFILVRTDTIQLFNVTEVKE